jgi:hypothetical protein
VGFPFPVECQQYWSEAISFYQKAGELYAAGKEHAREAAYCVARGDAYVSLAYTCTFLLTHGVPPLDEASANEPYGMPDEVTLPRVLAKLEEVKGLRDTNTPPPPEASVSAFSKGDCSGWGYVGFGQMLLASEAWDQGDVAAYDFHMQQAINYTLMYQACVAVASSLS